MRPNLNAEHSGMFVRFLEMIGNLRSKRYDVELNYDLDITRCYYALRYTFQVAFADNNSPGSSKDKAAMLYTLDGVLQSISRRNLKVLNLRQIVSLCFFRKYHENSFAISPSSLISLLALLKYHAQDIPEIASFAKEVLWRLFIELKDYFLFLRFKRTK